jgi:hypothetical protein
MDDFSDALINVRSAFRLLYHFGDRILNLMKYIEKCLNIPCVSDKAYYDLPLKNKNNLTKRNWAWHWFPFLFYEFHFSKDDTQLSVFLQSDTGAWETKNWSDVDLFQDVKESNTRLIFAISKLGDWDAILSDEKFKEFNKDEFTIGINENKPIYCKAFDLEKFKDEETTKRTLVEYIGFIKEKGITTINFEEDNCD